MTIANLYLLLSEKDYQMSTPPGRNINLGGFWESAGRILGGAGKSRLFPAVPRSSQQLPAFSFAAEDCREPAHPRFLAGRWTRRRQGAKPHGRRDEVMPPKKPVSKIPTSNQEPTLSDAAFPDASAPLKMSALRTPHSSRGLKPTATDIEPLTRF